MLTATFFDGERWRDGVVGLGEDGRPGSVRRHPRRGPGPLRPHRRGFTDHHVHLQLVDHALLASSRLGRVVDLGGDPSTVARIAVHNSGVSTGGGASEAVPGVPGPGFPELRTVEFAGAFLTPPGGYPSDRAWAPAGSVREIADRAAAATAVEEMAAAGVSCVKVASNSTAGPVFSDALFRTIADLASARGLPVIAHAEGSGEAQRVVRLGATQLAHPRSPSAWTTRRSRSRPPAPPGSAPSPSTTPTRGPSRSTTSPASTPPAAPSATAPTWATARPRRPEPG